MSIKRTLFFIIAFFSCLSCYAEGLGQANQSSSLVLADKQWKLGFKDENTNSKIMEFIMQNDDSVNNWSELLTFQKFKMTFPKEVLASACADKIITAIKAKGVQYTYTSFESSPQEAIFEFRITSPVEQQHDELQRIIRTPDNHFIVLQYAVHKSDMGDTERMKIIDALKKADLSILE